jgi:hypothetical protein
MIAALLFAAAATAPAKLILPGTPPTVINYPSMQRCLAAKAAYLRQAEEQTRRDSERGVISFIGRVYCIPG